MEDKDSLEHGPRSGEELSVRQAGQRGGRATLQNHGRSFYRRIGRKGGQRTKNLYKELLKDFGQQGGRPKRPAPGE